MSTSQAIQAQQIHEPQFTRQSQRRRRGSRLQGSKGETTGEVALIVLVEQKKPLAALSAEDVIPPELEGMRTDVYEVGYLRAQQAQQTPKRRFRPMIPPGVSIGHYKVTAGTFGALVTDKTTGERFVLSNNHVLANSNDSLIGDAILQPGAIDGGQNPGDLVATLERFVKLRYTDEPVVTRRHPTPGPARRRPPERRRAVRLRHRRVRSSRSPTRWRRLLGSQKRVTTTTARRRQPSRDANASAPTSARRAPPCRKIRSTAPSRRPVDPSHVHRRDSPDRQGQRHETRHAGDARPQVRAHHRYTEGNITLLNATVNIAYNTMAGQKTARFVGRSSPKP